MVPLLQRVTFGWAGIPGSFPKVTRCKSGTYISHHLNNGYTHQPNNPKQAISYSARRL